VNITTDIKSPTSAIDNCSVFCLACHGSLRYALASQAETVPAVTEVEIRALASWNARPVTQQSGLPIHHPTLLIPGLRPGRRWVVWKELGVWGAQRHKVPAAARALRRSHAESPWDSRKNRSASVCAMRIARSGRSRGPTPIPPRHRARGRAGSRRAPDVRRDTAARAPSLPASLATTGRRDARAQDPTTSQRVKSGHGIQTGNVIEERVLVSRCCRSPARGRMNPRQQTGSVPAAHANLWELRWGF